MQSLIEWAMQNKWQVDLAEAPRETPERVFSRYAGLPQGYVDFLRRFNLLANEADMCWFLSLDDFAGVGADAGDNGTGADGDADADGGAWRADAFERISLAAAGEDRQWAAEIARFWDGHIPIVFRLSDGYEYYAIRLCDGAVVNGMEPEFEEASVAAGSFAEFLSKITRGEIAL